MDSRRILCIGHMGAAAYAPPNILASFQKALELGADMVEADLRRTSDGRIVLTHDEMVTTAAGTRVRVGEVGLDQLRKGKGAAPDSIMTLEDLLDFARGRCQVNLDIKEGGLEESVVRCLREKHMEEAVLVSCTWRSVLQEVKRLAPGQPIAFSYPEDRMNASKKPYMRPVVEAAIVLMRSTLPFRLKRMTEGLDLKSFMLYHRVATPGVVRLLHGMGLAVHIWTVDDPATLQRMLDMGADGIVTNRPDLLAARAMKDTRETLPA